MKSENAAGMRELTRHRTVILSLAEKWAKRFGIRIYKIALCRNHLHISLLGKTRKGLQNFFRVFVGHLAQWILKEHPTPQLPRQPSKACSKNQRVYWSFLIYTRILTWGREFNIVCRYIERNELEALGEIAYRPREAAKRRKPPPAKESL